MNGLSVKGSVCCCTYLWWKNVIGDPFRESLGYTMYHVLQKVTLTLTLVCNKAAGETASPVTLVFLHVCCIGLFVWINHFLIILHKLERAILP